MFCRIELCLVGRAFPITLTLILRGRINFGSVTRTMTFISSRLTWYMAATLGLTILLLTTGCSLATYGNRTHSFEERVASHVYHKPINELRSAALIDSITNDADMIASGIKKNADYDYELDDLSSAYDTADRFTVERKGLIYVGSKIGPDQFKVEIYDTIDNTRVRQPELEWEFLKRTDPRGAQKIEEAR